MVEFMAWPPAPSHGHSSGIRWYLRRGSSSMPHPRPKVHIGAYHLVGRLIPPNIACHASKISMLFALIWAEAGSFGERTDKGQIALRLNLAKQAARFRVARVGRPRELEAPVPARKFATEGFGNTPLLRAPRMRPATT